MKAKHQRLILALVALGGVAGAGVLAASALSDEAAYFRTPVEIEDGKAEVGEAMRLGGMVAKGSIVRQADGRMRADGTFVADRILAKHDERYMPPQMGDMPKNMKAAAGV